MGGWYGGLFIEEKVFRELGNLDVWLSWIIESYLSRLLLCYLMCKLGLGDWNFEVSWYKC